MKTTKSNPAPVYRVTITDRDDTGVVEYRIRYTGRGNEKQAWAIGVDGNERLIPADQWTSEEILTDDD